MASVDGLSALEYRSIDDILGAAEGRFFSAGFKRVEYQLGGVQVGTDAQGRPEARASASLSYPANWSTKSPDVALRPHLSGIDATLFGISLCELLITHHFGLDDERRRRAWLRGISIRAGSAPMENLADFPVSATLGKSQPAPGTENRQTSVIDCVIGTIKVRCEIDHEVVQTSAAAGFYPTAADMLGPDEYRYYGSGFRERDHSIANLAFTPDRSGVTAEVTVQRGPREALLTEGLGGQYGPSLSVLDSLVAMAQINQALVYLQDGIDRQDTNTLWLRKFTLKVANPRQPFDTPFEVAAHSESSDLLHYAGGSWRTFTMAGEFRGFSGRTLLAHRLPTTSAEETSP